MPDDLQTRGYTCRRCGRTVGPEILRCPDLRSGNCAFRKADAPPSVRKHRLPLAVCTLAGLVLGFGLIILAGITQEEPTPSGVIGAVFVGLFCAFITGASLFGLLRTYATYIVLEDRTSGLAWTGIRLLGLTPTRVLVARGKPLPAPPLSLRGLVFPPSVIAWSDPSANSAVAIFRATLLGLWARGVVQVCPHHRYVARWRGPYRPPEDVHAFSLVAGPDWVSVNGKLESRVLRVLSTWPTSQEALPWPHVYEIWPYGPSIYDLVRSVYGGDVKDPEGWVSAGVAEDAVGRGWRRLGGWLNTRYEPSPEQDARLQPEQERLRALSSQVAHEHPRLSAVLDKEITRAVRSRERMYTYTS